MLRLSLLASVGLLVGFAGGFVNFAIAVDSPPSLSERIANKAKVKGKFLLHQRTRTETSKGSGAWKEETQEVIWNASETAIIICDMWDDHYCKSAAERVLLEADLSRQKRKQVIDQLAAAYILQGWLDARHKATDNGDFREPDDA